MHSMYVVAIKDESRRGAWMGDTPFELSMIGFWNLIIVWLKVCFFPFRLRRKLTKLSQLLIPWRFFRLWSLLDGLDPPENMVRCMANNYSTLGFWRAWHRSYNLWVVRSVPCSCPLPPRADFLAIGTSTFLSAARTPSGRLWSSSPSSRSGMTSRSNSLPGVGSSPSSSFPRWELASSFHTRRCALFASFFLLRGLTRTQYGRTGWYRHLAALGGVLNILMMMTANLIGFAIGTEGMSYMWGKMIGTWEGAFPYFLFFLS